MGLASINLENDLRKIEHIVDQLVNVQDTLKQENRFLKRRIAEMSRSRASVMEKNRFATQQVKRIIQQLKEEKRRRRAEEKD